MRARNAWTALGPSRATIFSDAFNAGLADAVFDVEDLRKSELDRLDELTSQAITALRRETEAALIEVYVQAAITFAAEHRDAPRATQLELVPA